MIGFATISAEGFNGTTGGYGGDPTYVQAVTTLDEIKAFVDANQNDRKKILHIAKSIESPETMQFVFRNGSNLTIRGENGVRLKNFGFFFDKFNNVIIENLIIHEVFYPNDPITINDSHHFYIRNNELYSINTNRDEDKDIYDGIIDMKRGARYITIDNNYIHDHNKCLLIGHTDDLAQKEQDSKISVTICNNTFRNIRTRCPSIRYGTLHVFNNRYEDFLYDYAIAARCGAQVLIENNKFFNVKHVLSTKFNGEPPVVKLSSDNKYHGLESDDIRGVKKHEILYAKQLLKHGDSEVTVPYEYELT